MPERLTIEEVRHVAKLARLRLTDEQVEEYRSQISTVLEHLAKLDELGPQLEEPVGAATAPDRAATVRERSRAANRLDEDEVREPMPLEDLLRNAPAVEDRYLAVPKVLAEE